MTFSCAHSTAFHHPTCTSHPEQGRSWPEGFRRGKVAPGGVLVDGERGSSQGSEKACLLQQKSEKPTWPGREVERKSTRAGRMGCIFLLPVFKLILLGPENMLLSFQFLWIYCKHFWQLSIASTCICEECVFRCPWVDCSIWISAVSGWCCFWLLSPCSISYREMTAETHRQTFLFLPSVLSVRASGILTLLFEAYMFMVVLSPWWIILVSYYHCEMSFLRISVDTYFA